MTKGVHFLGVHSSFNLDQLVPGTPLTPIPTVPTLPTISEVKVQEMSGSSSSGSAAELLKQLPRKNRRIDEIKEEAKYEARTDETESKKEENSEFTQNKPAIPRNASQPAFTTHHGSLPKNGSVPFFDRIRKASVGERYRPTLGAIKSSSRGNMNSNGDIKKNLQLRLSNASFVGSRNNNSDDATVSKNISQIICLIGLSGRSDFYTGFATSSCG